jgi:hypothetical protein
MQHCAEQFISFGFESTHFCSDSDTDLNTNILTRDFLKWCLSLLSYAIWNLYDRGKVFQQKNIPVPGRFFSLSSVGSAIFHNFCFATVADPNSNPTFFGFGSGQTYRADCFGFGSTTLALSHVYLRISLRIRNDMQKLLNQFISDPSCIG